MVFGSNLKICLDVPIPKEYIPCPKDPCIVPLTLIKGDGLETVKLATSFINEVLYLPEMFMYRSLGYSELGNIPAAISDMSASIRLSPSPEKYRARAAFWTVVGEYDLAECDEQIALTRFK